MENQVKDIIIKALQDAGYDTTDRVCDIVKLIK